MSSEPLKKYSPTGKAPTSDVGAWVTNPWATGVMALGEGATSLFNNATKPDPPDSQTPGSPPTRANANQTALSDQLNNEANMGQARTGGIGFGTSDGLLDNQPKTASRVLLGS